MRIYMWLKINWNVAEMCTEYGLVLDEMCEDVLGCTWDDTYLWQMWQNNLYLSVVPTFQPLFTTLSPCKLHKLKPTYMDVNMVEHLGVNIALSIGVNMVVNIG